MAYEHLSRAERRAAAKYSREEALKRPAQLTPIEAACWPTYFEQPDLLKVWHSQRFLVQMFAAPALLGIECRRLSVCRVTLGSDGHWDANIAWDDLYSIKSELGFADWYGLEVYPRARDLVNVANMRHLWLLREPLELGWKK
jgi:hypothetical protein